MAITIPTCAVLTTAGVTLQDYLTSLYTWLAANPGNFTLSNLVGGATPTSWTATHSEGWQINFRVSGGTLLVMIAPSGGIASSSAPGTPAGSVEVIGLPAPVSTGARLYIARYSDALFFGWASSALSSISNATLIGRIGSPVQDQDVAAGIDGLGVLANIPLDASNTSPNVWYGTSGTAGIRQSRLRVASATWALGLAYPWGGSIVQASAARRFTPVSLVGHPDGSSAPSGTASPLLCLSKYTAWAGGAADSNAPLTLNESAGSNQAWLTLNSTTSNTRHRLLWDKTVDPTP